MLSLKTYSCGICKTTPDQISHHKSHIETQKHKDKRELFEFKLSKLSALELEQSYKTINITEIIMETETIITYNSTDKSNILTNKILTNKKKLKTCVTDSMDIVKEEKMSDTQQELKNKFESEMSTASNKEALKEKIHEIHNYLRNNGAGYGMNALKVFNILYGLKKIEEHGLLDKVSLKKPDCKFSYLLSLATQNKDEQLAELIFGNVLQSICESELRELLFYEIPQNIKGSVFVYLMKEIDKITIIEKTCNVLLSGKIYEYFIGRDESAISELGAYFTDRHIVEYILKKLNPSTNPDGTIPSMIDMFGGSGGFTTGYINYLNEKYPEMIDWTSEINKISHFDMNEDVIKSAGLEFFCLTGVLPNMNNLKYKNSFTDEFNGQKYKYPLTNPPYGGDDNKKTTKQQKREKVRKYIKNELKTLTDEFLRTRRQEQLKELDAEDKREKKESDKSKVSVSMCSARIQKFAKDNGLTGNDKECCSLMLLMDIVEENGTAIGVLKEGVFFNENNIYINLRKCLVEKFNVREIISIPQDQFENTQTKTSIIIFDNTVEKTSEVKFIDLIVERYAEDKFEEVFGDIVITENKGDIVRVTDKLVSFATIEEIMENTICSLNGKDYNKEKIPLGEGYNHVKIKDLCKINKNTEQPTKEEYNVVQINNVEFNNVLSFKTTKKADMQSNVKNFVKQNDILISCVRPKKDKLLFIKNNKIKNIDIENFVFTTALVKLETHDTNKAYFVYLMLYLLADSFEQTICKASQYPRFKSDKLGEVYIPIPSDEKIQYWTEKLLNETNEETYEQLIKELRQEAMPQQIALETDTLEPDTHALESSDESINGSVVSDAVVPKKKVKKLVKKTTKSKTTKSKTKNALIIEEEEEEEDLEPL